VANGSTYRPLREVVDGTTAGATTIGTGVLKKCGDLWEEVGRVGWGMGRGVAEGDREGGKFTCE
jgi:hypothetical protein